MKQLFISLIIFSSFSLQAMEESDIPGLGTAEEHIQQLFVNGNKPSKIVQIYGYTYEEVKEALKEHGTPSFDDSPRSAAPVPKLAISPRPTSAEITKEELLSPCPLSPKKQIAVFIRRGCGDEEILKRLSDVTSQDVLKARLAINQQVIDTQDYLAERNSNTSGRAPRPSNKYLSSRNIYIAAAAAAAWATYAGYHVAKNTPEQEWQSLSFAAKCKKVVWGVPSEMTSHVVYLVKRLAGR